jgi:cell division protein FtsW (lipid II flippase)
MKRATVIELAALAVAIALAWWIGGVATSAWIARVAKLGVRAPDLDAVRGLARRAEIYFTLGVVVLGAARVVGLRRAREPLVVPWLMPAVAIASLFGLAVHAATVEVAAGAAAMPTAAGFAQGFLIGCVAAAGILAAPIDLGELVARAYVPIAIAIAVIFAALAVFGSGPAGSGTRINLGPVQPIELVKPLAIAFLAGFLGARASKLRWQRRRILGLRWPRLGLLAPAVAALIAIVAALYVVGDLGPVLLLAVVFLAMFFVTSRATGWVVVAFAIIALAIFVLAMWPALAGGGTVQTRLRMWQAPWTNALANGHQLGDGLWAFSAGGWTGQGLAHAATPVVPAGKTDLVLATMTEQIGALGLVAYQLVLVSIIVAGLYVASLARTAERVLLAAGVAVLIAIQWFVIQAGTLGQLPLTGIVVPFVSAGRSSMAVFIALAAIVARLSVDARARAPSDELHELHGAVRGAGAATLAVAALAIVTGLRVMADRHAISGRSIVMRLADGAIVARDNPRLVAIAARIRRGSIVDRDGRPLAVTEAGARRYPLGNALGTLLGVAPSRVLLPPWALERVFDRKLRGTDPLAAFAPLLDLDGDARDSAIATLDADVASRSVTLALDARLQVDVGKLAAAAKGKLAVAAVVLDVDTGRVLARVQVPDYDPNHADWEARVLSNDAAFSKRFHGAYGEWPDKTGTHGMFQAGSVGKLYTAIAAVRAGAAGARFSCSDADAQGPMFTRPGWPKPIHDHTGDRTHGQLDLPTALAVSCNVYFGQLGLALGPDPLVGLRVAGVEVGYAGLLDPGPAGSRQLASTAFGQGAMVMSAMEAARLVAAIGGGGHYRRCPPTMELAGACTDVMLVEDPAALAPILAGMRRVMTAGTGAGLASPTGLRVYGKTGTADVRGFAGEEPWGIAPAQVAPPHSWFVAFAEPASRHEGEPLARGRIAVAVVVPRGGTGASAAGPLAMQILAAAQHLGYLQ